MSEITIRNARPEDSGKLLEIYSKYVADKAVSFETEVPSESEFKNRVENTLKKYPYVAAEIDGTVVGYAYASPFNPRTAYQWSAEVTVYVSEKFHGRGIGRRLYAELEKRLQKMGILNLYACIAYTENEDEYLTNGSSGFHKAMGYAIVGKFPKCGCKFGRWYDMIWMSKTLGEHSNNPVPMSFGSGNIYKAKPEEYGGYIKYIDTNYCGAVYPLSIAEGFQQGDVYADSRSALFWHYSGFAFLYGEYGEDVLDFVSDLLVNADRRFILFTDDQSTEEYFRKNKNVTIEKRLFFEYGKDIPPAIPELPDGFQICEINAELLKKLNGNITPYFSWDSAKSFLEKGKGYCIVKGNTAAAWAFSAAVSTKEIDIGIETNSEYRRLGLAEIAAKKMIEYCFEQNKRPVWACHQGNEASRKLAEKLGFVQTAECFTVKKNFRT